MERLNGRRTPKYYHTGQQGDISIFIGYSLAIYSGGNEDTGYLIIRGRRARRYLSDLEERRRAEPSALRGRQGWDFEQSRGFPAAASPNPPDPSPPPSKSATRRHQTRYPEPQPMPASPPPPPARSSPPRAAPWSWPCSSSPPPRPPTHRPVPAGDPPLGRVRGGQRRGEQSRLWSWVCRAG